jgi:hypothetical protein
MPRLIPFRLGAACGLALILLLAMTASASAKSVRANLLVIGKNNKVLAEKTITSGAVGIPTSKSATCFGAGTGGSGKTYKTNAPTALGLLSQAAKGTKALKPLSITDAFVDEFGLGICGVGGSKSTSKLSWYLKVNHKNPNKGGEQVKLKNGDQVLWALAGFPYPNQLSLTVPPNVEVGVPFTVKVFSYDDKGKKKPVAGAKVTGAAKTTGSDGSTSVTLSKPKLLRATHGKDLPSNGVKPTFAGSGTNYDLIW